MRTRNVAVIAAAAAVLAACSASNGSSAPGTATRSAATGQVAWTLRPATPATNRQLSQAGSMVDGRLAQRGTRAHVTVLENSIVVSAPASAGAAVRLAALPGVLTFREIYRDPSGKVYASPARSTSAKADGVGWTVTGLNPPPGEPDQTTPTATTLAAFASLDCARNGGRPPTIDEDPHHFVVACDRDGRTKYLLKPADLLGSQLGVTPSEPVPGAQGPEWEVALTFRDSATQQLQAVVSRLDRNGHQRLPVVLDGIVVAAPTVNAVPGYIIVSGEQPPFTQQDAIVLVSDVGDGPLPVPFTVSGPTG